MASQLHQLALASSLHISSSYSSLHNHFLFFHHNHHQCQAFSSTIFGSLSLPHNNTNSEIGSWRRKKTGFFVSRKDLELRVQDQEDDEDDDDDDEAEAPPPSPQDLQYIQEIKRVLDLLKKNRDMVFEEVKLTVMIEDPREVERRQQLGIDDPDAPTREDLAEALEQVYKGKVLKNRAALQMLAEEMIAWPNLEVEAPKTKPTKSLYAKATDTGIDPREAAKRLNIDWDSAAEIEDVDSDEPEVPPAVGYGALYLVTAFPVIIGISVVLILFYNSLQ